MDLPTNAHTATKGDEITPNVLGKFKLKASR
jgi:hypothetical protein